MLTHIVAAGASLLAAARSLTPAQLGQVTVVVTIYTALIVWILAAARRQHRERRAAMARLVSVRLYNDTYQVSPAAAAKLRCAALREDVESAIATTRQRLEAAPPRDRRATVPLDRR